MKHSKERLSDFLNSTVIKILKKNETVKIKGGNNETVENTELENGIIIDDIDNL